LPTRGDIGANGGTGSMGGTICSLDLGGVTLRSGDGGGALHLYCAQTPVVDPWEQPGGRFLPAEKEFVWAHAGLMEISSPSTTTNGIHMGVQPRVACLGCRKLGRVFPGTARSSVQTRGWPPINSNSQSVV
jgi:hypothetical protein